MSNLELREIAVTEWDMIERIGELRVRAWGTAVPQANEMTTWLDELDRAARHWAFLRDGLPVAAARLSALARPNRRPLTASCSRGTIPTFWNG